MIVIAINIYVTLRVVKSRAFSSVQKITISILIWVIPIVGAGIVYSFIASDDDPKGPNTGSFGGGTNASGVGAEPGGD